MDSMEAQRRAFEAQFGSLEEMGFEDKTKANNSSGSDSGSDDDGDDTGKDRSSDTDMLSDEEEEEQDLIYGKGSAESSDDDDDNDDEFQGFTESHKEPTVIKFVDTTKPYEPASKDELKMLKSGKAYRKTAPVQQLRKRGIAAASTTGESQEDLQNDLELQRFLQESHILSNFDSEASGADLTLKTIDNNNNTQAAAARVDSLVGKARRYTVNSRLKAISSINGHESKVSRLENISMAMRKGMVRSYKDKITKFEKDAKEGGIVLSKVKKGEFRNVKGNLTVTERIGKGIKNDQRDTTYRKKGLKINSVGRNTRNGLVISQNEIDRINRTGKKFEKGNKKRR